MKTIKRILVLLLLTTILTSCEKKPDIDVEAKGYFNKSDWKISERGPKFDVNKDVDTYYIEKKIILKEDFQNATDSVKLSIYEMNKTEIKNLPLLETILYKSLLDCKYACNNTATFKPLKIVIFNSDKNELYINIDFLASNAYGTPGELKGNFVYDYKTKKIKSFIF